MEISRIQKISRTPKRPKGHPLNQQPSTKPDTIQASTVHSPQLTFEEYSHKKAKSNQPSHMSPKSFTSVSKTNQMAITQFINSINSSGVSSNINAEIYQNRLKSI